MFVKLYRLWGAAVAKIFTVLCRSGFYGIGHETVIVPPVRLGGEKRIQLGRGVFIGRNSWLQVMDAGSVNQQPAIIIGDETSIVGSCTITAVESVIIEPRVLMAGNVYISDHTHAHQSRTIAIKDQGLTRIAPVRVCEGAWLGQNVVICPGVTIGRNAVVGANSVVRDDVPDYCVAVGTPAKVIRQIDQQTARSPELLERVSQTT